jgi:hypothetical protein
MPKPSPPCSQNRRPQPGDWAAESEAAPRREVHAAPTLVKYAQPNPMSKDRPNWPGRRRTPRQCPSRRAARRSGRAHGISRSRACRDADLLGQPPPPIRQIRDLVAAFRKPALRKSSSSACAIAAATTSFCAPSMPEPAALRHSHGHRRLSRHAPPSPLYADHPGIHPPPRLRNSGIRRRRRPGRSRHHCRVSGSVEAAFAASRQIAPQAMRPEAAQSRSICCRWQRESARLFKMDFAEALYISELRSGPAGHFSYRKVAWEMYLAVQRQHPSPWPILPSDRLHRTDRHPQAIAYASQLDLSKAIVFCGEKSGRNSSEPGRLRP